MPASPTSASDDDARNPIAGVEVLSDWTEREPARYRVHHLIRVDEVGRRRALDSINHRLALLDSVAHQVALIEELNARLIALEDRLWRNQVDQTSMEELSAKLQQVAIMMADRLEVTEQRLSEVSEQLASRK